MITIRRAEILFYCVLFMIAGIALGLCYAAASTKPVSETSKPDWTVANCSLWAGTSNPVLPKYTISDICVTDTGSLSRAFNPNHDQTH